jgi:DEAD/DEAH box helicase domain-containing protein
MSEIENGITHKLAEISSEKPDVCAGENDYFSTRGWRVAHTIRLPSRKPETLQVDDLPLSTPNRRYAEASFPEGVYLHQKEALREQLDGRNVCITTGTASGKSLVFYMSAIELLAQSPASRIVAIYPTKALGREQEGRWRSALEKAGVPSRIGRIDGQVPVSTRLEILQRSNVLIMTPDIVHAWLLSNLGNATVRSFLRRLSLMVVDEVHNYTGVFGSNAAFLFRRMQHAMGLLGASPSYVCASATIAEPAKHLRKLFGLDFTIVGPEHDTSPKHEIVVHFVAPPRQADLLSEVSEYLAYLASETSTRFIAFADSRKQTEHISSIVARSQDVSKEEQEEDDFYHGSDHLRRLPVLPFRAGYEADDRDVIQERLSTGALRGVVSTSALELGIDIPFLDTAVLIGVPPTSTSLHQRIGRIGRQSQGTVVVVNTGDVYNEAIFENPETLLSRPVAEGALYLENTCIQYIHALCLARHEGEHDQVSAALGGNEEPRFSSSVEWPDGFLQMCEKERLGEIPVDLQSMKSEAGESPNHVFPLRDVESQFVVELRKGPDRRSLGSLSYEQVLREAYPGAVYYYATQPYRVNKVSTQSKLIQVREEKKRYTTQPQRLPTLVFPNLLGENVYSSRRYGELIVTECNLQIRESLNGFSERRGPTQFISSYPADFAKTGVKFDAPRFTRNYFTTGVVVSHPALNSEGVNGDALANLLYEALFMKIPFERQDISFAVDKYRAQRGFITEGSRFLALYDQTYGSLRLSSYLAEDKMLRATLEELLELTRNPEAPEINPETLRAAKDLCAAALEDSQDLLSGTNMVHQGYGDDKARVICPGSKGLDVWHSNEEFEVEDVFFSPRDSCLAYRGRRASTTDPTVKIILPINQVVEVPDESKMGFYNYHTGEIEPISSPESAAA